MPPFPPQVQYRDQQHGDQWRCDHAADQGGRAGQPHQVEEDGEPEQAEEEVADVVAFLASARASLVTGACINVDGGQSHSLI